MEARVGTLGRDARFVTLLTGRQGRVIAHIFRVEQHSVMVALVGPGGPVEIHPDVRVRVVEVTH